MKRASYIGREEKALTYSCMRGKKPQKQVLQCSSNRNLAAVFTVNVYQEYAKRPQFLVLAGTKTKHFHFQEGIFREMSKALFISFLHFCLFFSVLMCVKARILSSQHQL